MIQVNKKVYKALSEPLCKGLDFQSIQDIVTSCKELSFLDLSYTNVSQDSLDFIASNLTEKIETLYLSALDNIQDEHINILVRRCYKIATLEINYNTDVTNNSLASIIENLKPTLVKLSVNNTNVNYAKLLEMKSMPKLKSLNCLHLHSEEIDHLQKQLPHIRIEKESANFL